MQDRSTASSRSRSVVFVGLTVAMIAVSAWITVPLGPVPFTLQMFAITFAICMLTPAQATAAIACYLLLGAVGVPVFSGMRGGLGILIGPTGGFLLGYMIGVPLAALFLRAVRGTRFGGSIGVFIVAGIIFTAFAYLVGCIQYSFISGVSFAAAAIVCVVPFVVVDVLKIIAAAACARAVRAALATSVSPVWFS